MNNDQPANGGKDSTVMKGKEVPGMTYKQVLQSPPGMTRLGLKT